MDKPSTYNVQPDDLVLLILWNQLPMQWKLGGIESTHPGIDGVVRIAIV